MSYEIITEKIKKIPQEYLDEISEYIDFVSFRIDNSKSKTPKRQAGILKGKLIMSEDFDEPLDDFKEYM